MSISTASYEFSTCSSSSASGMSQNPSPSKKKTAVHFYDHKDSLQKSQVVKDGWNSELSERVHVSPESIDDYIDIYVPSASEPPSRTIKKDIFNKWKPVSKKEAEMYPFLVGARTYRGRHDQYTDQLVLRSMH